METYKLLLTLYIWVMVVGSLSEAAALREILVDIDSLPADQADYMDRLTASDEQELQHPMINHHKFSYVLNNENKCGNKDVFVLTLIRTVPENVQERNQIRQTWGSISSHNGLYIVPLFIMGKPKVITQSDTALQDKLSEENKAHKDIVEGDFIDSYKNDTMKHLLGLLWAKQFCGKAQFILTTEDSTMVDPFHLISFLNEKSSHSRAEKFLYCSTMRHRGPVRVPQDNTFVTMKDYPYREYPTYCDGFAYILSRDVLDMMLEASTKVPAFWLGDVYITGFLPAKIGLAHTDMEPGHSYNMMQVEHLTNELSNNIFLTADFDSLRNNWEQAWDSVLRSNKYR